MAFGQKRIVEDIHRIKNETLQRIIDANGTYIEDSVGKKARKGVRGAISEAYRKAQREKLTLLDDDLVEAMMSLYGDVAAGVVENPLDLEEVAGAVEEEVVVYVDDDANDDEGVEGSDGEDWTCSVLNSVYMIRLSENRIENRA